jgi:hypothetical protein
MPGWRNGARAAALIVVVAMPLAVAGCARPAAPGRGSAEACVQFAVGAIRQHETVTVRPPACQGLTRLQVNLAISDALHTVAAGLHGKARQRARIASASRYLQRLVTAVPAPRSPPEAAPAAHQPTRWLLGLITVCTWVITVGLGLSLMAGWLGRRRLRRDSGDPGGLSRRVPARNAAHLGLAVTGLLAWAVYLATGVTGVAWAACALLLPAAALGMTLVFLSPPQTRRSPVLIVGVHIAFATVTILFAFLTAVSGG